MEFNCKMVHCSNNRSVGKSKEGVISKLSIGRTFLFDTIYSSDIVNISFNKGFIIILTRNTMYTFEEVEVEQKEYAQGDIITVEDFFELSKGERRW